MAINLIACSPDPGPNWIPIGKKRLTIQGFAMSDLFGVMAQLSARLTPYVMAGKIKCRAHILEGLESASDVHNLFFTGGN